MKLGNQTLSGLRRHGLKARLLNVIRHTGLSQGKFALRVGTTRANLSGILLGKNLPGLVLIENIADAFRISPAWLLWGHGQVPDLTPPEPGLKPEGEAKMDELTISRTEGTLPRLLSILEASKMRKCRFAGCLGISPQLLNDVLHQGKTVSLRMAERIACLFDVSIYWLLWGQGPMSAKEANERLATGSLAKRESECPSITA